jgi:hypothetical protein
MSEHGFDVFGFKDDQANGSYLIHHAVKLCDNETACAMINFVCQQSKIEKELDWQN